MMSLSTGFSALKEEMRALEADKAKAVQEAQALKDKQRRDAASCRRDTEGTKAAVDHARKAQAAMGTCREEERGVCVCVGRRVFC